MNGTRRPFRPGIRRARWPAVAFVAVLLLAGCADGEPESQARRGRQPRPVPPVPAPPELRRPLSRPRFGWKALGVALGYGLYRFLRS